MIAYALLCTFFLFISFFPVHQNEFSNTRWFPTCAASYKTENDQEYIKYLISQYKGSLERQRVVLSGRFLTKESLGLFGLRGGMCWKSGIGERHGVGTPFLILCVWFSAGMNLFDLRIISYINLLYYLKKLYIYYNYQ